MALYVGGKKIVRRRTRSGGYQLGEEGTGGRQAPRGRGSLAYERLRTETRDRAVEAANLEAAKAREEETTPTISASEGFVNLYERRRPEFARVQREEAELRGAGGYSTEASTEYGAGTAYAKYAIRERNPKTAQNIINAAFPQTVAVKPTALTTSRENYPESQYVKAPGRVSLGGRNISLRELQTTPEGRAYLTTTAAGTTKSQKRAQAILSSPGIGYKTTPGRVAISISTPQEGAAPGWGQSISRGFLANAQAQPYRNVVVPLATSYAVGAGTGILLGKGTQLAARATLTKFGVQAGVRTARATQTGLTIGGGILGAGYLAVTEPQQIGRDIPVIVGGMSGFSRTYAKSVGGITYKGTPQEYVGITKQIQFPKRGGQTAVYRTSTDIAGSGLRRGEAVYEVFGKPVLAKTTSEVYFSGGATVVTPEGSAYSTKYLSRRTATFDVSGKPFRLVNTETGVKGINLATGTAQYTSKGRVAGIMQNIRSKPFIDPTGQQLTAVRSAGISVTKEGITGIDTRSILTPDKQTLITGPYSISRPGITVSGTAPYTETSYRASSFITEAPISKAEAKNFLQVVGMRQSTGIPKSQVSNPRVSRLYADPTGGILSSLATPKAAITTPLTTLTPITRIKGLTAIEPGIGLTTPNKPRVTTSFAIFAPLTQQRQTQNLFSKTQQRQTQLMKISAAQTQRISTLQTQRINTNIRFDTRLDLRQANTIGLSSIGRGTVPPIVPEPVPPRTPPPFLGGFAIPTFGLGGSRKQRGRTVGRGFSYQPSVTAGFFGITGAQQKTITGFEVRPIKKRRKKK